jgi:sucrose phosphorylase
MARPALNPGSGVMLITYADSLGKNINELAYVLDRCARGAVAGIHLLPFYPSAADRGFSPLRYDAVDPAFGSWGDVAKLAGKYYLMYDFMINHLSSRSPQFQDFLAKKEKSPYAGMFIRYKDFWPGGEPTKEQNDLIYKRKPRGPYVNMTFRDGKTEKIWCTFGDDQIDLDIRSAVTWRFIEENLRLLAGRGAALVRLDAFAYAVKRAGGSCFFEEPGVWEVLEKVQNILSPLGAELLPEIHEHYSIQMKLAERGYMVYDFALPMLLLHALHSGETANLAHWLRICPRRQFTTLDTHDGIGVVDARDLLSEAQIASTKDYLFNRGGNAKMVYNTEAYKNLDLYQINCTYYSALGENDAAYATARAVQMFAPGVPQVYYVGMLAGKKDIALVEATKNGRDINRHGYTLEEIEKEVQRPVVKKILGLMRFRNEFPAFGGKCEVGESGSVLTIKREDNGYTAELKADMKTHEFTIVYTGPDGKKKTLEL